MPRHKTETLASLRDKAFVGLPNMNRQSDKYYLYLAGLVSKRLRIKSNDISCHRSHVPRFNLSHHCVQLRRSCEACEWNYGSPLGPFRSLLDFPYGKSDVCRHPPAHPRPRARARTPFEDLQRRGARVRAPPALETFKPGKESERMGT